MLFWKGVKVHWPQWIGRKEHTVRARCNSLKRRWFSFLIREISSSRRAIRRRRRFTSASMFDSATSSSSILSRSPKRAFVASSNLQNRKLLAKTVLALNHPTWFFSGRVATEEVTINAFKPDRLELLFLWILESDALFKSLSTQSMLLSNPTRFSPRRKTK